MHSRRRSKNLTRFPNLRQQRSWESSWSGGSRNRSKHDGGTGRTADPLAARFFLGKALCGSGLLRGPTIDFSKGRFWSFSGLPTIYYVSAPDLAMAIFIL
jgi:hypothetical protein